MIKMLLFLFSLTAFAFGGEVAFTPSKIDAKGGSLVVIKGEVEGQKINMTWDFKPNGKGVATNGAMFVQYADRGQIDLKLSNDFGRAYEAGPKDWYLVFTLGRVSKSAKEFDSKKDFAIPKKPYSMITLAKGGVKGSPKRVHAEKDKTNKMTAYATEVVLDKTKGTAKVVGGLKSTWNEGKDWIEILFDVTAGSEFDRNARGNVANIKHALKYSN